jgi:hypothetical protein
MVTNSQREGYDRWGWPGKGKMMDEGDFEDE